MFKDKIKPPLVLTIICVLSCCIIVFAYEATYVDNSGVITPELAAAIGDIYGGNVSVMGGYIAGFEVLRNEDESVYQPEGVTAVIVYSDLYIAYEIIVDGYEKDGIHALVGLNANGELVGISFIEINDTPGLGDKVADESFLSQFTGLTNNRLPVATDEKKPKYKAVWGSTEEIVTLKQEKASQPVSDEFELDAITGATYSSKGVYAAVELALNTYANNAKG